MNGKTNVHIEFPECELCHSNATQRFEGMWVCNECLQKKRITGPTLFAAGFMLVIVYYVLLKAGFAIYDFFTR